MGMQCKGIVGIPHCFPGVEMVPRRNKDGDKQVSVHLKTLTSR